MSSIWVAVIGGKGFGDRVSLARVTVLGEFGAVVGSALKVKHLQY